MFKDILNIYNEGQYTQKNIDAVAQLSYWCGIASKMNWGLSESGAHFWRLVPQLQGAFDYQYVHHLYVTDHTPQHWRELIDQELEAGRPVLYAGYTSLIQGHAFVIDGRDTNGFYHINWGYGGNYDGYYNLDVLNTFEQPWRPTETGRLLGHFCNQEMILLHPSAIDWKEDDSLPTYDNLRIDSVRYSRQPDGNAYVTVDIFARNITSESITTAVELLTFELGDTSAFHNAEYLAITGTQLNPYESGRMRAYCKFSKQGKRIFGISDNDLTFLYQDTIEVLPSVGSGITIVSVDTIMKPDLTFLIKLRNHSSSGWAGNQITYSLFEGEYTPAGGEWRQWSIMNLPPDGEQTDTISFGPLKKEQLYTFVVRNPWIPAYSYSFSLPVSTDVQFVRTTSIAETLVIGDYDLMGRPVNEQKKGIIIRNGRKYLRK